jgi:hypothetical protein
LTDTFGTNDKRKKLIPLLLKNFNKKKQDKINIPKNLSMNLVNINTVTKCLNILLKNNSEPNNFVIKSKRDVKIFDLINFLNDKLEKKIKVNWLKNTKNYRIIKLKNLLKKDNNINKQILELFNENN